VKDHLRELVLQALLDLKRAGVLPAEAEPAFVIERTKSREHGDYATNVALLLAKLAGRKPRELAEALAKAVPRSQHLAKVEIAGPGFINFHLNQACRLGTLRRVFEQGERYGYAPAESREPVQVEFVSANPNGPLHVGHGRGAAYGASGGEPAGGRGPSGAARVLRQRCRSPDGHPLRVVWLRYLELGGVNVRFPDNGYKGDYVVDIARGCVRRKATACVTTRSRSPDLPPDEMPRRAATRKSTSMR
jgi:arginyl-tRNA synthetase